MMEFDTSILCDYYPEDVNVVEPIFSNFGGVVSFSGQAVTVKCFEDNGLLYEVLQQMAPVKSWLLTGVGRYVVRLLMRS